MNRSKRAPAPLALAALAVLAACESTHELDPPMLVPREVREVERYQIQRDGEVIGAALLLEIVDPAGPLRFWRFENPNGAWVGHATEQGRFSRRVPFRDDEEDLGVWSMSSGVANLLGAGGPVQLREVPVAAPATAHRQPRPDR